MNKVTVTLGIFVVSLALAFFLGYRDILRRLDAKTPTFEVDPSLVQCPYDGVRAFIKCDEEYCTCDSDYHIEDLELVRRGTAKALLQSRLAPGLVADGRVDRPTLCQQLLLASSLQLSVAMLCLI